MLFALLGLTHTTNVNGQTIQSRYQSLDAAAHKRNGLSDAAHGRAIALQYAQLFSPLQLSRVLGRQHPSDTKLLFRAANIAEFYSHQARFIADMSADLKRLEQSDEATSADYADLYRALIDVRNFERARLLIVEHPSSGLVPLPSIKDAPNLLPGKFTELFVDIGKHGLVHRSAVLPTSSFILVAGSPMCHFTRNAIRDLESDPAMKELFAHHAQWVAPQDGNVAKDFDGFVHWNREHPDFQMSMTYKASEWPLVDTWATPTFYFIKDGKVAAKLVGWPDEGNIPALAAAAREIGLIK